uniref:YdcF family protein n=1 Tax=Candidatus Vondammii sp. HM_W22 TaxID=2687299 RepID=UPI002E7B592E|nr:hypothetical protein [Candidatus Vondammii sp. HM_W22]
MSSGGNPLSDGPTEAAMIREILEKEFGVKVAATGERSLAILENARLTKPLLEKLGIKRVLLGNPCRAYVAGNGCLRADRPCGHSRTDGLRAQNLDQPGHIQRLAAQCEKFARQQLGDT